MKDNSEYNTNLLMGAARFSKLAEEWAKRFANNTPVDAVLVMQLSALLTALLHKTDDSSDEEVVATFKDACTACGELLMPLLAGYRASKEAKDNG